MPHLETTRPERAGDGTTPRSVQRLGGLLIAALGAGVAWLSFTQALEHGSFLRLGAMMGPAFVVMGLALVLFPGPREERVARGEDISALTGQALITRRWWVVVGLAVAAGLGYSELLQMLDLAAAAVALGIEVAR